MNLNPAAPPRPMLRILAALALGLSSMPGAAQDPRPPSATTARPPRASSQPPLSPKTAPPAAPEAILYFFTTPAAPGSPAAAARAAQFVKKHAGRVLLRPVLLLEDFSVIRRVTDEGLLTQTLSALGDPGSLRIPLYDEEGLALAEQWKLRSVPAFVLVARGRAHRALGSEVNLEVLWDCAL